MVYLPPRHWAELVGRADDDDPTGAVTTTAKKTTATPAPTATPTAAATTTAKGTATAPAAASTETGFIDEYTAKGEQLIRENTRNAVIGE